MKGYWIVRCEYHDQEAFEEYAKVATEVVSKNDGKFLVLSLIHISEPTRPY